MNKNEEFDIVGKSWKDIIHTLMDEQHGITEIETNGNNLSADEPVSLFIKQKGKRIEYHNVWHNSVEYAEQTAGLLDMIDSDSRSKFLAEGRIFLDTGETARVHVVLPPASDYPQVTIAKKSLSLNTLEAIRENGSFNKDIYNFLIAAIDCNFTMAIVGPTGAGKTTILEAMTKHFKDTERIGIVEDSQELQLAQGDVTYLHSTLWRPGQSRNDVASLSWCVQQLNRQRVDKIIIGETRGGEFADFIVAANSGCEGSMTTLHANNPKTALQKMSNFMMTGLPQPRRSANESIAQTIDFIVQLGFDNKGNNRLLQIENVSQTLGNDESANISTNAVFKFKQETNSWEFSPYMDDVINTRFQQKGYDVINFTKASHEPMSGNLGKLRNKQLAQKSKFNFGAR